MIDSLVVSYAARLAALMLIGAIETTVLIKMRQTHDRVHNDQLGQQGLEDRHSVADEVSKMLEDASNLGLSSAGCTSIRPDLICGSGQRRHRRRRPA
jgi:hypothetical protein